MKIRDLITNSKCEVPQPYWGYEDMGIFCLLLVALGPSLRLLERFHLLPQSPPRMQLLVILFLMLALYTVLKFRYWQPVLVPLGWVRPRPMYFGIALILGPAFAASISLWVTTHNQDAVSLPSLEFLVTGTLLAPILEESLFRGCLLPILSQSFGAVLAVTITAALFALFHGPSDLAHWVSLLATGLAYGWLRLASRSTLAAALMHASYNLALMFATRF